MQMNNRYETYWTGFKFEGLGELKGVARVKINFFSEYGYVAYQIKRTNTYSNVVANILHTGVPPLDPWGGVKTFFYWK